MSKKENTAYYENTDFSDYLKKNKKKTTITKPKIKRVTINLSEPVCQSALLLDEYLNMGYQNVLKAALFVGLQQLSNQQKELKKLH
jgi:hypothetical protein